MILDIPIYEMLSYMDTDLYFQLSVQYNIHYVVPKE